jgi:lipopolysaccharide/colanic/teichoic acid biosynthesis glycosyltransferase
VKPAHRCLLVGTAAGAARVADLFRSRPERGWRAAAAVVLEGDAAELGGGIPVHSTIPPPDELRSLAPDAVVLAAPGTASPPALFPALREGLPAGTPFVDGLHLCARWKGQLPVELLAPGCGLPGGMGDGFRPGQRATDVALGVLLSVLTLPLVAVLALLVRLETRGAPLFTQERIGQGGRPFRIWKLRSMVQDAEADGAAMTEAGDERITRVGRLLRRWRLDELPQLWNVVRGEMSLVGPRPERAEFLEPFEAEIPLLRERLRVPPGVTGWAQVRHGYAATAEETREKLGYDLYYLRNRSLALDLEVALRTAWVLLSGRGVR